MTDTQELKMCGKYLKKLIAFRDTEPVKVVTGIWRYSMIIMKRLYYQ